MPTHNAPTPNKSQGRYIIIKSRKEHLKKSMHALRMRWAEDIFMRSNA